jgi:hypothetical protein
MDRDYKLSLIAFALFREKQNKPFNFSRKTRNLNTIASKSQSLILNRIQRAVIHISYSAWFSLCPNSLFARILFPW